MNRQIDKLPIELHIPSYIYCGPGTKVEKRLIREDKGINPLDEACKRHDISYSKFSDINNRNKADQLLATKVFQRFKSFDATLGERLAALGVTAIMKAKSKLGMGIQRRGRGINMKRKRRLNNKVKTILFQSAVQEKI